MSRNPTHPAAPNAGLPDEWTPRELAELYAAGALSQSEVEAFEARVRAGDEVFVRALQEVRPAMERLLNIATPLTPPAEVRAAILTRLGLTGQAPDQHDRRADRVDHDENPFEDDAHHDDEHDHEAESALAGAGYAGITILRAATGRWKPTGLRGVRYRTLMADRKANRRTMMLEMAPGSELPDHSHAGIEEVYMISGDISFAGQTLRANDYIRIERGAHHGVPRTENGCVCIVISDYVPFPMTSMLGFVWSAIKSLFGRTKRKG